MRSSYLFTSESVSEGHPDKVADQISDAIVDLFLSKDPEARVACETMTTTNRVVLAGEIRGQGIMDQEGNWAPGIREEIEGAVRGVVKRIGYEQNGFHWDRFDFANHLHPQSAHIAQGVDAGADKDEGAGDQGIMFGFACDETPDLMPATLYYSHKILSEMAKDRHSGAAPFLEPDAKSQVTLRFEEGKPAKATAIVVSTQHKPGYDKGEKQAELHAYVKDVVARVMPQQLLGNETVYHINPTGAFEIGGPEALASGGDRRLQVVDEIDAFPGEQLALRLATEVAVSSGRLIDRFVKAKVSADTARGQTAELADAADRLLDRVVADCAGAVRIDIKRQRLGDANCISELDRAALR